jgi:hypothetical protein
MDDIDALLNSVDEKETHDYEKIIRASIDSQGEVVTSAPDVTVDAGMEGTDGAPPALDDLPEPEQPDVIQEDASPSVTASPAEPPSPAKAHPTPLEARGVDRAIRGSRTWNTREPYILSLKTDDLQKEKEYLKSSFYFIKEWNGEDAMRDAIREHLVQFVRRPQQTIQPDLEHYIYTTLIAEIQKILSLFQFTGETGHLFIYHCGPMTVYRMIMSTLQHRKCGFCYRLEPGNRSVRFFPEEFIKEKILGWLEENINILNLPFDSIQHLNEIKNTVAKKYSIDVKRFNHTVEQINMKLGQDTQVNRDKLLSLKGEELFGLSAIEVYKRFIDRTIFHRAQ